MKFIGFWEYDAEDVVKVIEKSRQMMAERDKGADRFAKTIFGPFHISGEHRGFTIFETDDPDKLANISIFYTPEMRWEFLLINDSAKLTELYLKMKK